jgi:sulfonate dioxygenase
MSTTVTQTIEPALAPLSLRTSASDEAEKQGEAESYQYTHLLPHFSQDHYPSLTPFDHIDPGQRALAHPNPCLFLDNATSIIQLTPNLGTEVQGVNLAVLDSDGRDQLALEVLLFSGLVYLTPLLMKLCIVIPRSPGGG